VAIVPSYRTWTDGETVTAAMLNSNIRDDGQFWVSSRARALLRQTVAQSLTSNTWAALTFDVEDLDNDGGHSTVTNTSRYTAQTAGWLRAEGLVCITAGGSQRGARWAVNGTPINAGQVQLNAPAAGSADIPACGRLIFLNVGDYIELQGFQNSGGALNTAVATTEQSQMTVVWEGS
jgi:hypothetical protein